MKNRTKNKLINLNDHLFAQMERLGDEGLAGEKFDKEILRAKALSSVAAQIINNASLAIKAMTAINEGLIKRPPAMLGMDGYDETE